MSKKQVCIFLILLGMSSLILSFWVFTDRSYKLISLGLAIALFIGAIIILLIIIFDKPKRSIISKLILLNNDGEQDREWAIYAANSLIVGKSTRNNTVDIDLGDNRYEAFIAVNHAVLNRIKDEWYIEDLNTVNGIGLKKSGDSMNFRLTPGKAYKVDVGDIIYISKVRLLAR